MNRSGPGGPYLVNTDTEGTRALSYVPPPLYWVPLARDLGALEALLTKRLKPPQQSFGRQYLGLTIEGRRVLQARGFCWAYYRGGKERLWERSPVSPIDAAGCAFQVDYDPVSATLGELEWGTEGP